MLIFKLVFSILAIYLIGYAVFKLILPDTKQHFVEKLALSFGLGSGTISLVSVLMFHARVEVDLANLLFIFCPLVIGFLYIARKTTFRQKLSESSIHTHPGFSPKGFSALEIFLIIVIVISIGLVSFQALFKPMFTYDALSIWAFKAKILFKEQTIFTDDFYDSDRLHYHPRYPLLIPLVENWVYNCLGCVNDRVVKIIFPLFYISLISLFYSTQRRLFSRRYSLIFTALLATIPAFVRSDEGGAAFSGYVDVPLTFFYTTGIIYLFLWMKFRKREDIIISTIFSGLSMFTKNEGLGFFAIMVFCICIFVLCNSNKEIIKENIKSLSVYIIIPILIILPWFIIASGMPSFIEDENYLERLTMSTIVENFSRIPVILSSFCKEFMDIKRWNVFWILFGTVLFGSYKLTLRSPIKYILLIFLLNCLMFVLVYVITPWDVKELISCSMTRLIIQITPLAVFLSAHQTGMILNSMDKKDE